MHKNTFHFSLLIIAGLVVVAAIIGLVWGFDGWPERHKEVAGDNASVLEKCQSNEAQEDIDACFFNEAQGLNQSALCGLISDSAMAEQCHMNVALRTGDVTGCFEATNPSRRDKCVADVAFNGRNPNDCALVVDPDAKDRCVADVAGVIGNADVCVLLRDDEKIGRCRDAVNSVIEENQTSE